MWVLVTKAMLWIKSLTCNLQAPPEQTTEKDDLGLKKQWKHAVDTCSVIGKRI